MYNEFDEVIDLDTGETYIVLSDSITIKNVYIFEGRYEDKCYRSLACVDSSGKITKYNGFTDSLVVPVPLTADLKTKINKARSKAYAVEKELEMLIL